MMLTFSAKWTEPILGGKKDVTLRKWPTARVEVGGVYGVATMGYPPKKFARAEVTALRRITLRDIDEDLARRDGASLEEVQDYWKKQGFGLDDELWLVEFRLKPE
jgi:hypothetical protein